MTGRPSLSDYTSAKLRVADLFQSFLRFAEQRHDDERIRYVRELLADLAEDTFRVALFGKYNRGKSTLMNALIGTDRLPTGVLPLTSVVTTVRYDSREHVEIVRSGWSFSQEIPVDQLRSFVTEEGNPGNEKQVVLAQVYLRADLLRYGFFLIDTPGIGSSIAQNTRAAESFIPRADVAIVVMSAESPLDQQDFDLLERVHREVGSVFVVLNKADLLPPGDYNSVLQAFTDRVRSSVQNPALIVPLSAKDAISQAEGAGSRGVGILRDALIGFVSQEKTSRLIVRAADRIQALLHDERAIDLLSRQSPVERRQATLDVHSAITAATEDGDARLRTLLQRVSTPTDPLSIALADWISAQLDRVRRRDSSVQDVAQFLGSRGLLQPSTLVPDYADTARRLNELIREVKDHVSAALPGIGLASAEPVGEPIMSEKISSLPSFQWRTIHRVLTSSGLAIFPLVARLVMRPNLERFTDEIVQEIARAVNYRIELLKQQYGHAMEGYSRRGDEVYSRLPASSRTELLSQIAGELTAIRRIGNGPGEKLEYQSGGWEPAPHQFAARCSVCEELSELQYRFIREYQYKLSSDAAERARNAERGGFCAFHTWLYESMGSPQGISTGYAPVLLSWANQLGTLASNQISSKDLHRITQSLRSDSPDCRICDLLRSIDVERTKAIASQVEPDISSFCVLHTCDILLQGVDGQRAKHLLEKVSVTLRRTAEDMQQFALKQSGLRSFLTASDERAAYARGLRLLVGEKQLSYIKTVTEI